MNSETHLAQIQCSSCGAQVSREPYRLSYSCSYCQSNIVDSAALHEAVDQLLPFLLDKDAALEALGRHLGWERLSWAFWVPKVKLRSEEYNIQAWWIPAFMDRGNLRCNYQAQVGVNWQEMVQRRVGKETRMEMVQRTEWFPLSGTAAYGVDGFLSLGSSHLSEAVFSNLLPFDVYWAREAQAELLAGTVAWSPDVPAPDRSAVAKRLNEHYGQVIQYSLLPGDQGQLQHCDSDFEAKRRSLVLLPLWRIVKRADKRDESTGPQSPVESGWWIHGQSGVVVGPGAGGNPYLWLILGLLAVAIIAMVVAINLR